MRIMAVDYGDARTGVAVSDASASLAGETWVISERGQKVVADKLANAAAERGVGLIVVGYPKNMDGTVGPRAAVSESLAALIREKSGAEVVLWDERMTTMSAHRILSETGVSGKKRKKKIDAVAASIILESYLRSRI